LLTTLFVAVEMEKKKKFFITVPVPGGNYRPVAVPYPGTVATVHYFELISNVLKTSSPKKIALDNHWRRLQILTFSFLSVSWF
jgi:hypothetical protein